MAERTSGRSSRIRPSRRPGAISAVAAAAVGVLGAWSGGNEAIAATRTWDGGLYVHTNLWSNVANWTANTPPAASGDDVVFGTGYQSGRQIDLDGNRSVKTFSIDSANNFTLVDNTLTVSDGTLTRSAARGFHRISSDIVLGASAVWASAGDGRLTVDGEISGAVALQLTGTGTFALTGANTFGGAGLGLAVDGGATLIANADPSLGDAANDLSLDDATLRFAGAFDPSTRGITIGAGGATFDTDGNDVTFSASIGNGGLGGLTKTGAGTLTLAADNTFAGETTVSQGTLLLDCATNNGSKIASGAALNVAGGTLSVLGNGSANTAHSVSGLSVRVGESSVRVTAGAGQDATLELGAITRSTGGTVDFVTIGSGASIGTTAGNTHGILGGYATLGGDDFAANDGANQVVAFSAYDVVNDASAFGANQNITNSAAFTGAQASIVTINSLRFGASVASTLNNAGGALTIGSGGILVSSGVGANASAINGGTLTSGNGSDLIVHQNNAAAGLAIGAAIVDDGVTPIALTKSGAGTLVLSGANSYTGGTILNGGVLQVSSDSATGNVAAALGRTPASFDADNLRFNGGTLRVAANNIPLNANRGMTLLDGGGTIDTQGFNLIYNGVIAGSGDLVKAGSGTLVLSESVAAGRYQAYSGDTILRNGTLGLTSDKRVVGNPPIGPGNGRIIIGDSGTQSTDNLVLAIGIDSPASTAITVDRPIEVNDVGALSTLQTSAGNGTYAFTGDITLRKSLTWNHGVHGTPAYGANTVYVESTIREEGGSHGLIKTGADGSARLYPLILAAANSYSGGTTILGGSVAAGDPLALGTGAITINGGVLAAYNGAQTIGNQLILQGNAGFGGEITQSGLLPVGGRWDLTLSSTADTVLPSPETVLTIHDSAVVSGNTSTITLRPNLTGDGKGIVKAGPGKLILTGNNSYTGVTKVSAGTLQLGASGVLPDGSDVFIESSATLNLAGFNEQIASLAGAGTITDAAAAGLTTLTVAGSSDAIFDGAINDGTRAIRLVKAGSSTQSLGQASAYSGGTIVANGTLLASNDPGSAGSATGSGQVLVQGVNASLGQNTFGTLGGIGRISGTTIIEAGDTLAGAAHLAVGVGSLPGQGTLRIDNSLTLNGHLDIELFSGSIDDADKLIVAAGQVLDFGGSLNVSERAAIVFAEGMTWDILDFDASLDAGSFGQVNLPGLPSGLEWDVSQLYETGQIGVIAAVPEPGVALAGAFATVSLASRRRRRASR